MIEARIKHVPKKELKKLPRGLVVCMSRANLERRLIEGRKDAQGFGWYKTRKQPKGLEIDFPLYIAVDEKVIGYLWIHECSFHDTDWDYRFYYHSDTWTLIDNGIPIKHSGKWRYYPPGKPLPK